jgi:hypothetical protein
MEIWGNVRRFTEGAKSVCLVRRKPTKQILIKYFLIAGLILSPTIRAETDHSRAPFEIGLERFVVAAPAEAAGFSGLALNYWFAPYVYLGTTQMALYYRGQTEYRPDFRLGAIIPLFESFYFEVALGVNFFTGVLIALAIIDEDNSLDYKFASNFYAPYFTLTSALRFEIGPITLKLIGQTQLGGYIDNPNTKFNASLWMGLGATYRFAFDG